MTLSVVFTPGLVSSETVLIVFNSPSQDTVCRYFGWRINSQKQILAHSKYFLGLSTQQSRHVTANLVRKATAFKRREFVRENVSQVKIYIYNLAVKQVV